ncbi:MAG: hypothetical protein U0234_08005 [Sandaracinus sp.]
MRGLALALALGSAVTVATAQDALADAGVDAALDPAAEAFQRAIDSDPWSQDGSDEASDPLGAADTAALATVTDDPDVDEVQAPVPVRHGEIVEAIAGVSMRSHAMSVTLEGGLAVVTEQIVMGSSARHRAEAMLRLALPPGAALVAMHVENASGARDAVPADASAPQSAYDDALLVRSTTPVETPVAHARIASGALVLRAAPIGPVQPDAASESGALTVRVTWAVPVPLHGGVARLVIPARGTDDRAAPVEVTLTAVDLVEPRVDGSAYERGTVEATGRAPLVVTALAPLSRGPRVDTSLVDCGAGRCALVRAMGGRARLAETPITIAIDASPSTTIGARGRITDTVRVVSALLPARARVRWIAFAAHTETIGEGTPGDLDLARVRAAIDAPLGSATRFSALWGAVEPGARAGDRILVIGDGGLTDDALEQGALAAARERGVVVSTIDVADRPATATLARGIAATGGVTIEAGAAADRAAGGHGDELLGELVSAALATSVGPVSARIDGAAIALGTLRTGESITWMGPATRAEATMNDQRVTARAPDAAHAGIASALASHRAALIAVEAADLDASAGACDASGAPRARATARASSIVGHGRYIAPAHRRSCETTAAPAATSSGATHGLPGRVLRDQLRRRVIPPARACFRDDRAGRAHVHREVTFELVLADREIARASVTGDITDELRTCLLGAFDGVEVPSFDGTLVVRWPLHTEAVVPPPVIELAPDVAREVHAITGDAPVVTAPF